MKKNIKILFLFFALFFITFSVKAYDECGLIGEGEHERFIVDDVKFQSKANGKLNK